MEKKKIIQINIKDIQFDKEQPRKTFEDIGELASSILKEGLIEPLKVRKDGNKYILIDGERRLRALQLLNKKDKEYDYIDCIILSSNNVLVTQLITDIHKHKLDPFEEAQAIQKVLKETKDLEGLKCLLGKSTNYFTRRLRLLRLNNRTQKKIKEGSLPISSIDWIDFAKEKLSNMEDEIVDRIEDEKADRDKAMQIVREVSEKYEKIINNFIEKVK